VGNQQIEAYSTKCLEGAFWEVRPVGRKEKKGICAS
jgi:hypothetical protein